MNSESTSQREGLVGLPCVVALLRLIEEEESLIHQLITAIDAGDDAKSLECAKRLAELRRTVPSVIAPTP